MDNGRQQLNPFETFNRRYAEDEQYGVSVEACWEH